MRTKLSILLTITMILALIPMSAFAGVPVTPLDPELVMYAEDFEVGDIVSVNFDPYLPLSQVARLNPTNALGPFDAIAPDGVSDYFFATGAREWSHFTFEDKFVNVDGAPDIEFAEITWGTGGSWHTEAMLVYLTDAFVRDSEGDVVPYGDTDDGIGYFAGIAWNRIGLEYVDAATRLATTENYFLGTRDFADNEFYRSGPYGTYTQFHLPDEVVFAEGIHLVDITADVYDLAYPATFLNVGGTGALVTLNSSAWDVINYTKITEDDVNAVLGTDGNTDGYDLDAIRVYKYVPEVPELFGFCGYKLDADTGEGLAGWTIILLDEDDEEFDRTITGREGMYCFEGLPAGEYEVVELEEDGWKQVFPEGGSHMVTLPEESMIFGIERTATRPILQIDPMTGDVSHVFDTNNPAINDHSLNGPNGLAYDSGGDTFYYVTYPYDSEDYGNATLFRYVRGEASAEELYELDHEIACADFYDGKYYYIAGGPKGATDDLYEVVFDGDGEVSDVNSFLGISGDMYSWTFSGDIAISPDGVIYGVGLSGGSYQFFSVERDGTNFNLIDPSIGMPLQLAFSRDGVLFGNNLSNNSFYTVDLVTGDTALTATSKSAAAFNDMASGIQYYNFENLKQDYEFCVLKTDADTENPIMGWDISLYSVGEFGAKTFVKKVATDADGKACFDELEEGEYFIEETLKEGWKQIEPDNDPAALNEGFYVSLPGDDGEEFEFVNAALFDLCGYKYGLDWNGFNMEPWSTDKPMAGWTITLLDSDGELVAETSTDVDGHYCFQGLRAGDYTIVESFGEINGYGFWEFNSKFWKPVLTDEIEVTLPDDASDCEDHDTHHNFYNMCYTDETAWMFGDTSHIGLPGLTSNNWGWSENLGIIDTGAEYTIMEDVPIYAAAGQNDITKGYLAGYLDICWDGEKVVICNLEAEDWTYLEGMKVWVGNKVLPSLKKGFTNAPGKLVYQDPIEYGEEIFIAVHFESWAPCEFQNTEIEIEIE